MNLDLLADFLHARNLPDYRFRQIKKHYYSGRYSSFDELTDLPLSLRSELADNFPFLSVKPAKILSAKSTRKALLTLTDGRQIESVLMDYRQWQTVCVSSQVGCPLGCLFCATGKMGFVRQLSAEELIDQILFWKNYSATAPPFPQRGDGGDLSPAKAGKRDFFRIVFMGMGEPFLNWDNLLASLKVINSPDGLNIGQRKISLSTAGIVPKIIDFANLNTEINLAVSLHSADQKTRRHLMPIAKQYPLPSLLQACRYYTTHTRRQLFFEYALIKNQNDSPRHLRLLIDFLKTDPLFYLNLISLNPTDSQLSPSPKNIRTHFESELRKNRLNFSLRRSFGQPIAAACGQLATAS